MTGHLCLEGKLNSYECTNLIKFIAVSMEKDIPWKCKHVHFLVVKSIIPGSGVAVTLSCDLSGFPWKNLLQKHDLDLETVRAIVSLKGMITPRDVVHYVKDDNFALLKISVDNSTPKLDDSGLIKLCEQAIKWKKFNFAKELMNYSLSVGDSSKLIELALKLNSLDFIEKMVSQDTTFDPALIVSKMRKMDIQTRTNLNSYIMSTPEGCVQLLLKAVEYFEFKIAEKCLKAEGKALKNMIDLGSMLNSHQGNSEERQQRIQFIEKLLKVGFDPNGHEGKPCPLDVVLELSKDYQYEKEMLLMLLLQHGATIERCTYQRGKGTTLIHEATKFAIDSGKTLLLGYFSSLSLCYKNMSVNATPKMMYMYTNLVMECV